jgi:hypothetical protein
LPIEPVAHVQRRVGADRQRHQADQCDGNGDGAAGDAKLRQIHRFHSQSFSSARQLVAPMPVRFVGLRSLCRSIAINLRHCNKETLNPHGRPGQPPLAHAEMATDDGRN